MKKFSEFGVKRKSLFVGKKIKISEVLNRIIEVHCYKIEGAKFGRNKSGKCLHLQIKVDGEDRVLFTGSDVLIEQIQQIECDQMPFEATINQIGECYSFN